MLKTNKKTEVDHIFGSIVQKGMELGVPTPLNEVVLRMINEIEEHKRPMSPKTFKKWYNWLKNLE